MRLLIYGFGERLKSTLMHFDIDFDNIDITDSNTEIWNTVCTLGEKRIKIIPTNKIRKSDYALCMIGSKRMSEEIKKEILNLGFDEKEIVPFEWFNSLWERWKKQYDFFVQWKNSVERDSNIAVIKNWYIKNDDAECIVRIRGEILNKVTIRAVDLCKIKHNIEVVNLSKEETIGTISENGLVFDVCSDEMVLKIIVKNAISGIPWIAFFVDKSKARDNIEKSKLGEQLLSAYISSDRVPYYDEDYLVIHRAAECEGTILDVGAQFGQSMHAFYRLTNKCNIISIEVNPNCFEELVLLKNVIDTSDRVKLIHCGVSDKEENLIFYEPTNPSMAGSFDSDFINGRKLGGVI